MNYCNIDDIFNVFGQKNILDWSNIDGLDPTLPDGEAKILARIEWSIRQATSSVNEHLLHSPYQFPIEFGNDIPNSIVDITAKIAGLFLYRNARRINEGVEGMDETLSVFEIDEFFREVHGMRRVLEGMPSSYVPVTSIVFDDTETETDIPRLG